MERLISKSGRVSVNVYKDPYKRKLILSDIAFKST